MVFIHNKYKKARFPQGRTHSCETYRSYLTLHAVCLQSNYAVYGVILCTPELFVYQADKFYAA